jgi:1-acyl-sn-glycerol-3-phosphate acyltransferase
MGRENLRQLPNNAPIVFAGNHIHEFDTVAIGISTPRNPHFLAKIELAHDRKFGWLVRQIGPIFVDRDVKNSALDNAIETLREGKIVVIYPEGTSRLVYKKATELLPFKLGAVKMARATKAWVVPFAIAGEYKLWRRPKIKFGVPFQFNSQQTMAENNEELRDKILKLMRGMGVKNPRKILGKPAKNPSKQPPIIDKKPKRSATMDNNSERSSNNG